MIFGGKTGKAKEPVYRIDCETFEADLIEAADGPTVRESHSSSLIGDEMIVWGGCQNQQVRNLNSIPQGII